MQFILGCFCLFFSAFSGQCFSLFLLQCPFLLFFFFFSFSFLVSAPSFFFFSLSPFSPAPPFLFSSVLPFFSAQKHFFQPKTFFSIQNIFASAQNVFYFSPTMKKYAHYVILCHMKKNTIEGCIKRFNYLSIGYIHRYCTGPPRIASRGK